MLKEGQKAPAWKLPSDGGGELSLADLAGKWAIIYFYPRDDTPGCTVEAHDFRDAAKELAKREAAVVGISKDSIASHCKFRDKHGLNFPLLSDPDAKVIEKYGAWGEKNMYGKKSMGIVRTTVLVAPDGKVAKVFPKVKVKGHVEEVIAAIDEARLTRRSR
jgi:peroxiredoxin Q/BCP